MNSTQDKLEILAQWETGRVENSDLAYNIQMAKRPDGVWLQRHIWHKDSQGEHCPPLIDNWIIGTQCGPNSTMVEVQS